MALHARRSLIPKASFRRAQLSAWPRASTFLSHEILQRGVVQHGIGQQTLQSSVLVLQRLQPARLRDVHPTEAGLPVVDRGVADPVLATQIGDGYPGLVFLQNSDDLVFREAAALHVLVHSMGQNELESGLDRWGNVSMRPHTSLRGLTPNEFATRSRSDHKENRVQL